MALIPTDPLSAALNLGAALIERIFPDPAQRDAAKLELLRLAAAGDLAQAQTNTAEATNPNWFVSGWRPFVGWVCGLGLAYQFLFFPLLSRSLDIAPLDGSQLNSVLLGMLGLGGIRALEKLNGVASK